MSNSTLFKELEFLGFDPICIREVLKTHKTFDSALTKLNSNKVFKIETELIKKGIPRLTAKKLATLYQTEEEAMKFYQDYQIEAARIRSSLTEMGYPNELIQNSIDNLTNFDEAVNLLTQTIPRNKGNPQSRIPINTFPESRAPPSLNPENQINLGPQANLNNLPQTIIPPNLPPQNSPISIGLQYPLQNSGNSYYSNPNLNSPGNNNPNINGNIPSILPHSYPNPINRPNLQGPPNPMIFNPENSYRPKNTMSNLSPLPPYPLELNYAGNAPRLNLPMPAIQQPLTGFAPPAYLNPQTRPVPSNYSFPSNPALDSRLPPSTNVPRPEIPPLSSRYPVPPPFPNSAMPYPNPYPQEFPRLEIPPPISSRFPVPPPLSNSAMPYPNPYPQEFPRLEIPPPISSRFPVPPPFPNSAMPNPNPHPQIIPEYAPEIQYLESELSISIPRRGAPPRNLTLNRENLGNNFEDAYENLTIRGNRRSLINRGMSEEQVLPQDDGSIVIDDFEMFMGLYGRLLLIQALARVYEPKGLSEEYIEKLPITKFSNSSNLTSDTCVICYDDYTEGIDILLLPCNHPFHPECIKTWLKSSTKCPLCKNDMEDE